MIKGKKKGRTEGREEGREGEREVKREKSIGISNFSGLVSIISTIG